LFEIGRDQDVTFQSDTGRVCRNRIGEVAGRGAGHDFETELARATEGDGDDAIFE
jgi:hypothetical protein